MPKKLQPINYTSRDFDSIRRDLEGYAQRYYPNTYKDFNEAGFGSLMLDTVSYIGDILSFYLDYQTNESFLDSAVEYNNVVRLAKQMGFKLNPNPSSYGTITFYIAVPSSTTAGGAPDLSYAPVLKGGSTVGSTGGGAYMLLEDIDFSNNSNLVVAGAINSATDQPNSFIIRALGRVVSGRLQRQVADVGSFQKFLRIPLATNKLAEVISVTDSEGHRYYEVDNLSQNIVYKAIRNTNADRNTAPTIMKAVPVARRFVVEYDGDETFLQFGYGSDSELLSNSIADPSTVIMDLHGRDYITDKEFDPTNLIKSDKFGIAPANTTLTINYRSNTTRDVNAATNTVVEVGTANFKFKNQGTLDLVKRNNVTNSMELTNESPIVGGVSMPSSEEIRQRVISYFATQHRAVTLQDYQTLCYAMPAKFGSIKRVAPARDFSEFKRNLNLYIISEDPTTGKLTEANATLKTNLKTWMSQYKMINDTIDILNARIANFAIEYVISVDYETNKYTTINKADGALRKHFSNIKDIGESINISEIYKILHNIPGVVDASSVNIISKSGGNYSQVSYDFDAALSANGLYVEALKDIIFELKYPNMDIKGSIR